MNAHPTVDHIQLAATRSALYKLLSKSFLYPTSAHFRFLTGDAYEAVLNQLLAIVGTDTTIGAELTSFVSIHREWRESEAQEELEAEYNRLFAHLGSTKCPPYETEYGYENIYQKADAMADIGGFYAAFGLEISADNADRPDFLGTELEFMSFLALKELYALEHHEDEHLKICLDAQSNFLADHLGRWTGIFARILSQSTSNSFYAALGKLTECLVQYDANRLGISIQEVDKPVQPSSDLPIPFQCEGCVQQGESLVPPRETI